MITGIDPLQDLWLQDEEGALDESEEEVEENADLEEEDDMDDDKEYE